MDCMRDRTVTAKRAVTATPEQRKMANRAVARMQGVSLERFLELSARAVEPFTEHDYDAFARAVRRALVAASRGKPFSASGTRGVDKVDPMDIFNKAAVWSVCVLPYVTPMTIQYIVTTVYDPDGRRWCASRKEWARRLWVNHRYIVKSQKKIGQAIRSAKP